jgi:diphthamide biosynthesis methyltransferase
MEHVITGIAGIVSSLVILEIFTSIGRKTLRELIDGYNQRKADEQEHRQELERRAQKHAQKLAAAEKLRDVLGVLIADAHTADTLRAEVDRIHVRVEEPDAEPTPRTARRRRAS